MSFPFWENAHCLFLCLAQCFSDSLCIPSTLASHNSMVYQKISSDMKECALRLWDQGWKIEEIMDALGVSRSSIFWWQAIFDEHGSVNRLLNALKGPEQIITRAVLTAVHTLYETDSDLYLNELVLWLAVEHDITISVLALHVTLKKAGLTRKLLHKIAIEHDNEL